MSNPKPNSIILGAHEYRSETSLTIGGNGRYQVSIIRFPGQTAATGPYVTSNSPIFVSKVGS
jgi:hypothetical protein